MYQLIVTTRDGTERKFHGQTGRSVMENIRDNGIEDVAAICGGMLSCATCHVYIHEGKELLPPMSDDESDLLDGSSHRRENSRLSCQIVFEQALDGLHVVIAPED